MFYLKNVKYKDILDIKEAKIKQNQLTVVVGESGSGKTTFLNLLNKMISADSGDVYYKDQNIKEIDSVDLRREVMMMHQKTVIYPKTIKDNLKIASQFSNKEETSDNQLKEILNDFNLNKSLNDNAYDLSEGEKQRLALARIIVAKSQVLLLDEPTAALDKSNEKIIVDYLKSLIENEGKTIIMVSHSEQVLKNDSINIIEIKDKGVF